MSGYSFNLTTAKTKRLMQELGSRVQNIEPPLRGFGYYKEQEIQRQFDEEVDPDGKPWAELAPSTLAKKRREGYPDKILTRTGKMQKTVKAIASSRNLYIKIGFPGGFHQRGTSKMPQRRILGINDRDRAKLRQLVRIYVGGRGR